MTCLQLYWTSTGCALEHLCMYWFSAVSWDEATDWWLAITCEESVAETEAGEPELSRLGKRGVSSVDPERCHTNSPGVPETQEVTIARRVWNRFVLAGPYVASLVDGVLL